MALQYFGPDKPLDIRAFTRHHDTVVAVLESDIIVSKAYDPDTTPMDQVTHRQYTAIWDTGATGTVISPKVVQELGLVITGQQTAQSVGIKKQLNTYLVNLVLPHKVAIMGVPVMESEFGGDVLVGMDIITMGDFAVTNFQRKTSFTFRVPSVGRLDFVREIEDERQQFTPEGQRRGRNRQKRKRKGRGK